MRQLKTVLLLLYALYTGIVTAASLPSGFVYLDDVVPDIMLDIRYASTDNFIGKPIDGYVKPVAITTSKTASALKNAQADFKRFGLGLKVFDAYRPQRAVDHFVRWAKDWHDTLMKSRYYPQIAKKDLFRQDYIAAKSGHSRSALSM
jgi:D-alanyl-D-alanine dipeptidase